MISIPYERELSFWPVSVPAASRIELHCRCQINFGSQSSASQTQTTGTDEADIITGKGAIVGGDNSLVLGAATRYAEQGSIQAGGTANVGNVSIGAGADVGLGDDAVLKLVQDFSTATTEQVEAFTALADRQGQQLSALAQKEETEEKNEIQPMAWIAGAAIVALGLALFLRR